MKLPADWSVNNGNDLPPERQAREAMSEALGAAPDEVSLDGRLHRFKVEGDSGTEKTGWYVLHGDGVPAGAFGDWRRNITQKWHASLPADLTEKARALMEEHCRRAQELRDEEMRRRRKRAAETCREIWKNAPEAKREHSYLQRKKIENHGLRMTGDGRLIMPIYIGTELSSLQYIRPDGRKEFHYGGEIGGGYFRIPAAEHPASEAKYIVEGYATGASVHEATGCEVWVALNAGNLGKVGRFLRENLPNAVLAFVADNDESGVGQKKAQEAAEAIGAKVIVPPELGDANDYAAAGKDLRALLLGTKRWILPVSEFCKKPQPIRWLIKNWVQEDALMMAFGAPGAGKTFVVLDMALSIACPQIKDWHGFKVKHGPVVYLAGEGYVGLKARIAGWMTHKNTGSVNMYVSDESVDLNTPGGVRRTVEEIRSYKVAPKLIVVDTLNRFMVGDENKAQDAKTMLDACAALEREFQCTVILVHHTGVAENAQGRARGSSAWRGAMDIELAIVKETDEPLVTLKQTKNKDAEMQPELYLEQVTIDVPGWFDEDGEQITTKVMELSGSVAGEVEKEKTLTKAQHFALQTYIEAASLEGLLDAEGKFRGLTLDAWREVYNRNSSADNAESKRKAFQRARNDLVGLKYLNVQDDIYTPIGVWGVFEKKFLAEQLASRKSGTFGDCPGTVR